MGLVTRPDWQETLLVAAGNPRFDTDDTGVAELVLMRIHAFPYPNTLQKHFLEFLQRIAKEEGGRITRNWVIDATRLAGLSPQVPSDIAAGQALAFVADECFKNPDIR